MDIVHAIGMWILNVFTLRPWLTSTTENVAKGRNDRPLEDVIIVDSGEVRNRMHNPFSICLTYFFQLAGDRIGR